MHSVTHVCRKLTLDRLPFGLILLKDDTSIAAMNREAGHVIGQNDGLSASKKGVRAAGTATNTELQMLIASAVRTGCGLGLGTGGFIAIPRLSGKRAFIVLVVAVGRRAFGPGAHDPVAAIFVTDPERKAEADAEALARIYGLTVAESRLTELLIQGETLVEAADRLRISHNTARTHLQRIYDKTGTHHRGDLIRLLATGVPCFGMNSDVIPGG